MSRTSNQPSPAALIVLLCAAEVLSLLGVFAFPALLPRFVELWGLTNTQAGWINGVYFAGYAAAVPVLASLTDRVDGRRIYLFGAAVVALSAAGFSLVAQGFWTALLFRVFSGLGLAGTFIPGLKALLDRVDPALQPRAVTYYTACFGLGTSLSFYAAGEVGRLFGWRWAFGGAGLGAVAALSIVAAASRPLRPTAHERPRLLDFRLVFRNRGALAYILAYAAHMWELFAFRSWAVAFLTFSLGPQGASRAAWAPSTVAAVGGLLASLANMGGGELTLRLGRVRVLTAIMLASAVSGALLGFGTSLPYPLLALLCIGYNLLVQADSSGLHMGTVEHAAPESRGATLAAQSLVGFLAASVSPLAVGMVLDLTGGGRTGGSWASAFVAISGVVALGPLLLRLRTASDAP